MVVSFHFLCVALAGMPVIEQCKDQDTTREACDIKTTKQSPTFTLDCTVTGFKPNISLVWESSSGQILSPLWAPIQTKLADGTWERRVTISVVAKYNANQTFICVAEGEAIPNGRASTTVTVRSLSDTGLISDMVKGEASTSIYADWVNGK